MSAFPYELAVSLRALLSVPLAVCECCPFHLIGCQHACESRPELRQEPRLAYEVFSQVRLRKEMKRRPCQWVRATPEPPARRGQERRQRVPCRCAVQSRQCPVYLVYQSRTRVLVAVFMPQASSLWWRVNLEAWFARANAALPQHLRAYLFDRLARGQGDGCAAREVTEDAGQGEAHGSP